MNNTPADGAKLERAVASGVLSKLEAGQIFLPRFNNALAPRYEGELLSWTGLPDETSDQVDMTSYAVHHVGNSNGSQLNARRGADGVIYW